MRKEIEVAGREIEFFVIARIVRDVHLAIMAGDSSLPIDHDRRVVIHACRPPFENRRDNRHVARRSHTAQGFGTGTRNRLREVEVPVLFSLARIPRAIELLQANHLGAARRGILYTHRGLLKIEPRLALAGHLDQSNANF